MVFLYRCFQWFKDTKMKANHNGGGTGSGFYNVVSSGSKILKWKQITTVCQTLCGSWRCFQWFKDTKMKANHNIFLYGFIYGSVVSSGSKILKWKQITTQEDGSSWSDSCFPLFKDTKSFSIFKYHLSL